MDTTDSEILHLRNISRKEFETFKEIVDKLQNLQEKYTDLEEKYNKTKEYIRILAEKDGLWCDICEKVLKDYEMKGCDGGGGGGDRCYKQICSEGHINFYDQYNGKVSFCSDYCMKEYEIMYNG